MSVHSNEKAMSDGTRRAGVRERSESATLVCAVSVAVALGVSCGFWINARLASAASQVQLAPARLMPDAHVTVEAAPAPPSDAKTGDGVSEQMTPAHAEEISLHVSEARSEAQRAPLSSAEVKRERRPAADGATPLARAADAPERSSRVRETQQAMGAEPKAARVQARAAPCTQYASAGSLNLRQGGAVTLVLGGPGETGRINVTTPDWADIAVLAEGRAGDNGWLKYSVRSVSRRAGVYSVHVRTPCGSQSIPVTVARP